MTTPIEVECSMVIVRFVVDVKLFVVLSFLLFVKGNFDVVPSYVKGKRSVVSPLWNPSHFPTQVVELILNHPSIQVGVVASIYFYAFFLLFTLLRFYAFTLCVCGK